MPDPSELSGWGAIATYLGVTERSAQEYEKKFGLPVHRMPGPRGRIWAIRDEIDFWKRAQDGRPRNGSEPCESRPAFRRPLFWMALASILAVSALAAQWWLSRRRGPATNYTISGRTLTVYDDQKRTKWSYQFPHYPLRAESRFEARILFSDFDGDGQTETLFAYYPLNEQGLVVSDGGTELYLFDDSGRRRWVSKFGSPIVTSRGDRYPGVLYVLRTIGRLRKPRPDGGVIVAGGSHDGTWAFQVEVFTASGQKVATYLHPGWFFSMAIDDINQDGVDEILLGGVNNGFGELGYGATLVVLDSRRVSGQGSVPPGDHRQAAGLPTGAEVAVLLFPEFAPQPNPNDYARIDSIQFAGNLLYLRANHGPGPLPRVDYRFDPHLRLTSVQPDLAFQETLLAALPKPLPPPLRHQYLMRKLGGIKVLKNDFASPR